MKKACLSDICSITMGQSPDSSTYNDNGNGLPFFQGNADFGNRNPHVRVWCSEPKKIAHQDDILISVRAPIGALNIANQECCIGRGLAALSVKTEYCLQEYLWYYLCNAVDELNSKGTGSTFKAINKNVLAELSVRLFDLKVQQRIVLSLNKVTELINQSKCSISKLDELIKSRFVEMFGDVVHNTKNWDKHIFSDIATSRLGKMLDTKKQIGEFSFPYLANFNVQWFEFNLSSLNQMDFDEKDQAEFALKEGDLLVCEGGEIGRCAIWHNEISPCYFQKALHRVRCNQDIILPMYLAWWFKFNCENKGFSDIEGAKATISHLPGAKLKRLNVVVPPVELQQQFANFVEKVNKSKTTVQQSIDKLETLKKSLMQEYFG